MDAHSRTGRDAKNTDRTRSGSTVASTIWAIRRTYELFKDTLVEKIWTQSCKVTSKLHMDGPHVCVMKLDLLMIAGLSWKEVSRIAGGIKKDGKLASLADVDSTFRRKRTTNDSIHNEMEKCTKHNMMVRSGNCPRQRIEVFLSTEEPVRYYCVTLCQPKVW